MPIGVGKDVFSRKRSMRSKARYIQNIERNRFPVDCENSYSEQALAGGNVVKQERYRISY